MPGLQGGLIMNPEAKMDILLDLGRNSIIKMTSTKARWNIDPYRLEIDTSFPPELWELTKKDKTYDWKNAPEVSKEVKDLIGELEREYNEAIEAQSNAGNEPKVYPIESFEDPEMSGFYLDDTTPSTIKLSDAELIKKIDVILHKTMPDETTYGTVRV
jgi:hypothetical protein